MIRFSCSTCGKTFVVGDDLAGRSASCKACGGPIVVPDRHALPEPEAPPIVKKKPPVRIRRLQADAEQIRQTLHNFPLIRVYKTTGDPPEMYQIIYRIRGLTRGPTGPVVREGHVVEIQLTHEYPRQSPKCRMLTPVFHPNIEPAMICVGDHWTAGERLIDLIIRIGEMIAYQAYNLRSPLDGEAAMWADQNAHRLPTDHRDLHPPDA
ncbi:ubiquitin-conjugating enzyme E2 [Lignipirellula cremea]|uniref:Ubiquitin-conjugating enzyme n=1 Tax=Lignipirellula cremea TaxID=2528010 RepID=A0A518DMG6_9BACT|nr:ubiquitin-conjugating enzyme E2 [Lignipirellula cremea]QDU93029.1 Ubiquitin-conjugating enzyme [Lignipirellula cremea]